VTASDTLHVYDLARERVAVRFIHVGPTVKPPKHSCGFFRKLAAAAAVAAVVILSQRA